MQRVLNPSRRYSFRHRNNLLRIGDYSEPCRCPLFPEFPFEECVIIYHIMVFFFLKRWNFFPITSSLFSASSSNYLKRLRLFPYCFMACFLRFCRGQNATLPPSTLSPPLDEVTQWSSPSKRADIPLKRSFY